jgi:uncharacterized protein (TIGR02231 family)
MNRKVVFLFLVLVVFSGAVFSFASEIEPVSAVQNIIVYPESAMIKKQAVVAVKKGQNTVRISGITSSMVESSVQASITGGAGVKIADVKVEKTYLTKTSQEKAEKLKSQLENIEMLIKSAANEIAVMNSSMDYLKKVVPFPQNQKVTTAEVDEHVKFMAKSLSENYEKIAKAEVRLKKLQEEKKAVERELKNLSNVAGYSTGIVLNLFSQEDNKEINLWYSYIVNGAGWSPQYDIRASSGANVVIDCFAVITQSTGEDWKDVDIEISTAKPSVYGAPPELSSWLVDIYQPRPVMYKTAPMMEREESMPMKAMMKMDALPEKPYEQPQIKAETTSFSFILPRKIDVPSDNQPHKILTASASKDSKFKYYAVPKLSKYSYLRAELKNPFQFPLIEGQTNVFLDDRLAGTSSLGKTLLPDDDVTISLGVDEGIKVDKKLVKKFTESAGAFTKETRINYEFVIDVFNSKDREIALTLNDNVPVSRNEKIKVEIESPKKDEAKIGDDGVILWDLKLAKGEKKSLKIKFKVEYPKDLRITGLE